MQCTVVVCRYVVCYIHNTLSHKNFSRKPHGFFHTYNLYVHKTQIQFNNAFSFHTTNEKNKLHMFIYCTTFS